MLIMNMLVYRVQRMHETHLSSCCCCDYLLTITPGHSGHRHGDDQTVDSSVITNLVHVTSVMFAVYQKESVHQWLCCIEETQWMLGVI